MNSLEKKSFYSFLILYISSSLLFVLLSGFWYYNAQKNSLESTIYYKLEHIADTIAGLIINAQMHNKALLLPTFEDGYEYTLISKDEKNEYKHNYYETNTQKILISSSPQEHLNIKYVVVKTKEYHEKLKQLKVDVLLTMLAVFVLIVIISFFLSKLFMRPIRQKVQQIENFIQDISHELNTPITALQMSSSRAIKKKVYDEKILTNISISTKQLYSIYKSLAYLSFAKEQMQPKELNLKNTVTEVIKFYDELSHAKHINIIHKLENSALKIDEDRAKLLISNLLSNAIKYSMPNTTITIILNDGSLSVKDEGVGIRKDKLEEIFKLYERSSNIAGGFGVGLSIVKQICDEVGIKVKVKSELNKGSEFNLSWKR